MVSLLDFRTWEKLTKLTSAEDMRSPCGDLRPLSSMPYAHTSTEAASARKGPERLNLTVVRS